MKMRFAADYVTQAQWEGMDFTEEYWTSNIHYNTCCAETEQQVVYMAQGRDVHGEAKSVRVEFFNPKTRRWESR